MMAVLMLAVSVAGALFCFSTLRTNAVRNNEYRTEIADMETEIQRLRGEGAKIQQQLSPDQQNLLIAAHKLVANKDFIWSRLFSDLESVMPGSVSASRIGVKNVYSQGDQIRAELEFAVLSSDYPSVMNMIDRMNNSGLFQAELRGQDLQKKNKFVYSEYTLRLIYTPTYRVAASSTTDVAQNSSGGAQ
jgi:Tfp pilus assembly protein PilN